MKPDGFSENTDESDVSLLVHPFASAKRIIHTTHQKLRILIIHKFIKCQFEQMSFNFLKVFSELDRGSDGESSIPQGLVLSPGDRGQEVGVSRLGMAGGGMVVVKGW